MQVTSQRFKQVASQKLADPKLQIALRKSRGRLVVGRANAIQELDNFEEIREAAARIRDFGLLHLETLLEEWESRAKAAGTIVHWAESAQDVNALVLDIAQRHGVRKIIKSKSMLGEETELNHALEKAGIDVRETDLGEYILQLGKEPPVYLYHLSGEPDSLSPQCAAIPYQRFEADGLDDAGLLALAQTMRTQRYALLDEIMATPLLTLAEALRVPKQFRGIQEVV